MEPGLTHHWLEGPSSPSKRVTPIDQNRNLIGESDRMKEVYRLIDRAGPGNVSVLITGARGTGKELVAQAIHQRSKRAAKPFVPISCGALTETLLQSTLFGHERGSFTGAIARQIGAFESADGGTIFLDEIGELPLSQQPVFLRVLQEREIERIGAHHVVHSDFRVIAATNRDLEAAVRSGRFRADLLDRLDVVQIDMPSLRERREDIPILAAHFIHKHSSIRTYTGFPTVVGISPEAGYLLATYDWPGNVRELEHAIERAIALGRTEYLQSTDFRQCIREDSSPLTDQAHETYEAEFEVFQKALFEKVIRKTNGNMQEAARRLGMNLKYFYRRCRQLKVRAHLSVFSIRASTQK